MFVCRYCCAENSHGAGWTLARRLCAIDLTVFVSVREYVSFIGTDNRSPAEEKARFCLLNKHYYRIAILHSALIETGEKHSAITAVLYRYTVQYEYVSNVRGKTVSTKKYGYEYF